jgi:hypothetical protein
VPSQAHGPLDTWGGDSSLLEPRNLVARNREQVVSKGAIREGTKARWIAVEDTDPHLIAERVANPNITLSVLNEIYNRGGDVFPKRASAGTLPAHCQDVLVTLAPARVNSGDVDHDVAPSGRENGESPRCSTDGVVRGRHSDRALDLFALQG